MGRGTLYHSVKFCKLILSKCLVSFLRVTALLLNSCIVSQLFLMKGVKVYIADCTLNFSDSGMSGASSRSGPDHPMSDWELRKCHNAIMPELPEQDGQHHLLRLPSHLSLRWNLQGGHPEAHVWSSTPRRRWCEWRRTFSDLCMHLSIACVLGSFEIVATSA